MSKQKQWTVEQVEDGLVALGRADASSPYLSDACLKSLQLLRGAVHAERNAAQKALERQPVTRLKRETADAHGVRITQLERMIAQYEPVAKDQEALGFGNTRKKVDAWKAELKQLIEA